MAMGVCMAARVGFSDGHGAWAGERGLVSHTDVGWSLERERVAMGGSREEKGRGTGCGTVLAGRGKSIRGREEKCRGEEGSAWWL